MSVTNIMPLKEAVKVFNKYLIIMEESPLNTKVITKEEYNKAHRALIKTYHTDSLSTLASKDAIQEINSASEAFTEEFKKTNIISLYTLDEIKEEYITKMNSFLSSKPNKETNNANQDILLNIDCYKILIKCANTLEDIEAIYKKFLNEIKSIYIKLELSFYKRYHLYDISSNSNYEQPLDAFYKNLLKIKDYYNIDATLNRELKSYQNEPVCKILAGSLNKIVEEAKKRLENDEKRNIVIPWLHENISSNIKAYKNLKTRLDEAKQNTKNPEHLERIAKIEAKLSNDTSLNEIDTMLKFIEASIERDSSKKDFEDLYKKLIADNVKKMQHVLQFGKDSYYPSTCLNRVLNIFNLAKNGFVNLETLKLLEKITYLRPDIDEKIFQEVERQIYTNIGKSNLYVKAKNFKSEEEENAIFIMLCQNEEQAKLAMWNTTMSSATETTIKTDELYSDFIPLEFYLTPENAVWEQLDDKYLLYKFGNNGTILAYNKGLVADNKFCILPASEIYKKTSKTKGLENFKYPDILTAAINEQKDKTFTIDPDDLKVDSPFLNLFKNRR